MTEYAPTTPSVPASWTRARFTAPPDAATVAMPGHVELEDALAEMVEQAGAVAVEGLTGTGKTFATRLVSARLGVETVTIRLGPRPGTSKVVATIYHDITGAEPPRYSTGAERRLEQVLAEKPRILIIDEAQKLGRGGIDQLIHLHEHPEAQFTLVLVGMNLGRLLNTYEELGGRFARRVTFPRLRGEQLLAWLAGYHPLLSRTDPDLLLRMDNQHLRGNLRRWAQVAHYAYMRVADPATDAISDELATAAIHSVLGLTS